MSSEGQPLRRTPHGGLTEADVKGTHPGFTMTCDQCGSSLVYVENSLGWSPESGGWGSLDIVCYGCGKRTTIYEPG